MNIKFSIGYHTRWGESVHICGNIPQLGNGNPAHALRLTPSADGSQWHITLNIPDEAGAFNYRYIVKAENGNERHEWGNPHHFTPATGAGEYEVIDFWHERPQDQPFYSAIFTQCICRRNMRALPVSPAAGTLTISVEAPMIQPTDVVALSGSCREMGNWNPAEAIVMSDADYPTWRCNIPLAKLPPQFEFKFLIRNKTNASYHFWECGANHKVCSLPATKGACMTITGMRLESPYGNWRGAGVAIPVFSLRSETDFGAGEFMDLCKIIDWAASTGQSVVQVLPVNDTTMTHSRLDSYPYSTNSCFALHPMYLHLPLMGHLNDPDQEAYYETIRLKLNALEEIDYERVNNVKNSYTRQLFSQNHAQIEADGELRAFVEQNSSWLIPYTAYCLLRDKHNTTDFSRWGDYATYSLEKTNKLIAGNKRDALYVFWLQMHLDKQLKQVRRYAHSRNVSLKGDIPIGISRNSVDAWTSPNLFNLDSQAGAPPDDFAVNGQNWGFPTYNWEEMSRDGFAWWKARFVKMAEYFDLYRIDHVLGFFRIWQIPVSQLHGLLGIFNPALPFTAEELRNSYDFHIDEDMHTTPYIMDWFLSDIFGEHTVEARSRFLIDMGNGRYTLKPDYATQRQIANYFATLSSCEKNTKLCNGLQTLVDQVLFIADKNENGKFHPRIAAQQTYIYQSLNDYERWCYDRLYNDFFYFRHNDFWRKKALQKLPALIDATTMLACGEDLGMIPGCVPSVMQELEILTLDIQRMPKTYGMEFDNPASYPYLSVCTTSTHDMPGIRQWWEENPVKASHYYNTFLNEQGKAPTAAEPWLCEKIIDINLNAPSMLCILPLQDWLSVDGALRRKDATKEQINDPSNPHHYWCYRMHITLEHLLSQRTFNEHIKAIVTESGR